jgi:hypothetical protein
MDLTNWNNAVAQWQAATKRWPGLAEVDSELATPRYSEQLAEVEADQMDLTNWNNAVASWQAATKRWPTLA